MRMCPQADRTDLLRDNAGHGLVGRLRHPRNVGGHDHLRMLRLATERRQRIVSRHVRDAPVVRCGASRVVGWWEGGRVGPRATGSSGGKGSSHMTSVAIPPRRPPSSACGRDRQTGGEGGAGKGQAGNGNEVGSFGAKSRSHGWREAAKGGEPLLMGFVTRPQSGVVVEKPSPCYIHLRNKTSHMHRTFFFQVFIA